PIEMRSQELLGGLKSDVGVKVYGDDLATLTGIAGEVAQVLGSLKGAADVRVEPTSGLPLLTIRPAPEKMGRLGVRTDEVRAAVQAMRAGRVVGLLAEGDRRFPVAVRMDTPPASNALALALTPITFSTGRTLPLGDVCDISFEEGPAQISREQGRRRILIEANVRQRDLGSFVQELQKRVGSIKLPPGYFVGFAGQYENLVHAAFRLAIIIPLTLAVIFVLLFLTFGEAGPALLIFMNIPIAASGGLAALAVRGLPLSISAAVGFIALFGVATLNGVVLLSAARRLEDEGLSSLDAARRAAHERLRPVLTTAVVASLGFLPMALATGTGAEVQRPLATVVIGGLVTATTLTLLLLPSLFARVRRFRASRGRGTHRSEPPEEAPAAVS
ncbi:MAG: efflux RND transporter permease subunit, partial [Polyangiaceae bacterium]